ncbi:MAG TPA: dienelactone hydrolase family protein [Candidatus Binataceae bacterium]
MSESKINIKTADGNCPCYTYTAPNDAPAPAVILYMDGLGIRPDLRAMAQRLASNGYFVLLPDLYYRAGDYPPFNMATMMTDEKERNRMMGLVQSVTNARIMSDTAAFLDFLSHEPKVKGAKIGCVGYCMGGQLVLSAAGTFPDRVAAGASIHGANLANDRADSPHLLAPKMRGKIYIGVAEIDPWLTPGETDRLKAALQAAKTNHTVEMYPGVQHGFAANGTPMYDRGAAERHWERIVELFGETLS